MNILILNWRDPKHPLSGGAEEVLYYYSQYWIKKGATVTWFASAFDKGKDSEVTDGIHIIRKGSHFTVAVWAFIYFLQGSFKTVDIVLDCFHFVPYFSKLYFWRKPVVALIHEVAGKIWFQNLFFPIALIGYLLEPLFLFLYRNNQIITGSQSAKEDLIKHSMKSEDITIVNHGFTKLKAKEYSKEKSTTIIFLGRLSRDKGIEDALMAFSRLLKKDKTATLWVVGRAESKKYMKRINQMVNSLQIKKRCVFFDYVTQEKKFELLTKAWVLVHPSIKEGWGLNVIEANSVGTPAVGYDVAGLKDSIVNGKTGLLVSSNVTSLADGLSSIVSNKERHDDMSKEAIKWSRNFTWEKAGEQSFAVMKKVYDRR